MSCLHHHSHLPAACLAVRAMYGGRDSNDSSTMIVLRPVPPSKPESVTAVDLEDVYS